MSMALSILFGRIKSFCRRRSGAGKIKAEILHFFAAAAICPRT
jgi:hypothetical protein